MSHLFLSGRPQVTVVEHLVPFGLVRLLLEEEDARKAIQHLDVLWIVREMSTKIVFGLLVFALFLVDDATFEQGQGSL